MRVKAVLLPYVLNIPSAASQSSLEAALALQMDRRVILMMPL